MELWPIVQSSSQIVVKILTILARTPSKQKLNFFRGALFHIKTRVCLMYFVMETIWRSAHKFSGYHYTEVLLLVSVKIFIKSKFGYIGYNYALKWPFLKNFSLDVLFDFMKVEDRYCWIVFKLTFLPKEKDATGYSKFTLYCFIM